MEECDLLPGTLELLILNALQAETTQWELLSSTINAMLRAT
jgi:hypothetical protein